MYCLYSSVWLILSTISLLANVLLYLLLSIFIIALGMVLYIGYNRSVCLILQDDCMFRMSGLCPFMVYELWPLSCLLKVLFRQKDEHCWLAVIVLWFISDCKLVLIKWESGTVIMLYSNAEKDGWALHTQKWLLVLQYIITGCIYEEICSHSEMVAGTTICYHWLYLWRDMTCRQQSIS